MSTRSQLTKDLNESVIALLGKHVKILHKSVVKLEVKSEKTENRVLVFSPCRLFLLAAKVPTRIDSHFHYLEIHAIESRKPNQISLVVGERHYSFLFPEESASHQVEAILHALSLAIRNIFPTVPFQHIIPRVDSSLSKHIRQLYENDGGREKRNIGPCGGFSTQYACMCDYHGLPYREEVSWDVDTIYLSHDTRQLCLRDFDHLDQKDLVPIISALEYNTWFTKLQASNTKLSHDGLERILHIVKRSISLEELYLENMGLKWDFAQKLSVAISLNHNSPLHTLDLSNNLIEDKGVQHLSGVLFKLPRGLSHLSLSHCGLSAKGTSQLGHTFTLNPTLSTSLTHLNLAGNSFKDDASNLCNFLAQPNCLSYLDISSTDVVLETIFGALLRGCATNLSHLNVSRNPFATKKIREIPPSFKQFFTSTLSLKKLNVAFCRLPPDALKNLLLGLACNESTTDLALDMSSNNLGAQGAHVLESCIHGIRCLSSLDISDNNMDVDLGPVLTAIGKNKSIKHLYIGRNLNNMKAKHIGSVMEALVQMLQEEDCVLQSLYIPDSKLKSDLYGMISALGSNRCLQTIDISGNFMGDTGARLLAKALQINSRLRTIIYDRNNITVQGYADIAYALESNYTVRHMPFPVHDVMPCMKTAPDRTDTVMRKIQELLHRNVSPKKYSQGQAFRLQQGLLSSAQQMVDRLVVQTQDTIRSYPHQASEEVLRATRLIRDADYSKQLLPRLQEVIQRRDESNNPVESKLRQVSQQVHTIAIDYLQASLGSMIKCAEEQCPFIMSSERVQNEIRAACTAKNSLEADFVQSCILEQAGTDIMNRLNDLNLTVAAHMSDHITDLVIESLSTCYKTLVDDPTNIRLSTPDVLRTRGDHGMMMLFHQPSGATPHLSTKRKSLYGRKLRPQSVVDGLSVDDIPDLLPPLPYSAQESLDSVSELPSISQQLQHLVKSRPRRTKTRAPTRPTLRPADLEQDLGEGLDVFFRPRSVSPALEISSLIPKSTLSLPEAPTFDASDSSSSPVMERQQDSAPDVVCTPVLKSDSNTGNSHDSPKSNSSSLLNDLKVKRSPNPLRQDCTRTTTNSNEPPRSPLGSRSDSGGKQSTPKIKPPLPVAPKPRPWSMSGDRKSGEFPLVSDGSSSSTSAANTPESGEVQDESADSGVASMGSASGGAALEPST